jgi:hypothetical protein
MLSLFSWNTIAGEIGRKKENDCSFNFFIIDRRIIILTIIAMSVHSSNKTTLGRVVSWLKCHAKTLHSLIYLSANIIGSKQQRRYWL